MFQIKVFEHGAAKAIPGGLWALDMREGGSEQPVRLIQIQIRYRYKYDTNKKYKYKHNYGYDTNKKANSNTNTVTNTHKDKERVGEDLNHKTFNKRFLCHLDFLLAEDSRLMGWMFQIGAVY